MAPLSEAAVRTRALRRGFTLVEVMVVIAIIAVLISILLPSLQAVRTRVNESRTQVAISVLETGIHQYLADTRCGGSFPPSAAPATTVAGYTGGQIDSPLIAHSPPLPDGRFEGASLLLWALAGADLLGTPGFQDLNGNQTWADDTGNAVATPTTPAQLYSLTGTTPNCPRSGPFVDLSKMKLPPAADPTNLTLGFVVPAAKANGILYSPCFLDCFDQPIVYYRANPNRNFMAGHAIGAANPGTYNLIDNYRITGLTTTDGVLDPGMDFGHGPLEIVSGDTYHKAGQRHYLASLGDILQEVSPGQPDITNILGWLRNTPAPIKYSFGYTIWNPSVTAVPRPHNDQSFILLSAGADGVFGTPDDLANFEVNR